MVRVWVGEKCRGLVQSLPDWCKTTAFSLCNSLPKARNNILRGLYEWWICVFLLMVSPCWWVVGIQTCYAHVQADPPPVTLGGQALMSLLCITILCSLRSSMGLILAVSAWCLELLYIKWTKLKPMTIHLSWLFTGKDRLPLVLIVFHLIECLGFCMPLPNFSLSSPLRSTSPQKQTTSHDTQKFWNLVL